MHLQNRVAHGSHEGPEMPDSPGVAPLESTGQLAGGVFHGNWSLSRTFGCAVWAYLFGLIEMEY